MVRCRKHKPKTLSLFDHHRTPKGECNNCVYFSKQNCGQHAAHGEYGGDGGGFIA